MSGNVFSQLTPENFEKRPPSAYLLPDTPCHNATPFASAWLGLGLAHHSPSCYDEFTLKNVCLARHTTNEIAIGAAHLQMADLDTIKQSGIEVILNLCLKRGNLHEVERAAGFIVYWLPLSGAYAPELDELEDALGWLNGHVESGKKVLVIAFWSGTFGYHYCRLSAEKGEQPQSCS